VFPKKKSTKEMVVESDWVLLTFFSLVALAEQATISLKKKVYKVIRHGWNLQTIENLNNTPD
jgi:hypothetical protein